MTSQRQRHASDQPRQASRDTSPPSAAPGPLPVSSHHTDLLTGSGYVNFSPSENLSCSSASNQLDGVPPFSTPWMEPSFHALVEMPVYPVAHPSHLGESAFAHAFSPVSISTAHQQIPGRPASTSNKSSSSSEHAGKEAVGRGGSGERLLSMQPSRVENLVVNEYPGAAVVSAKLASAVTFYENELSESTKTSPEPKVEVAGRQWVPPPHQPALPTPSLRQPFKDNVINTDSKQLSDGRRSSDDYLASGGGRGVYRAPYRGIVQPCHPISLELRPHLLREPQTSEATGTIICTETSLWMASEVGIRVWDIGSVTGQCSVGTSNMIGDEDAAAYCFLAVHGSPTLCLAVDTANQIVWSGHRDGKLRAWRMQVGAGDPGKRDADYATLSWQGHRTPVTAIAVTSYGELWTGSESGSMKAWPWEVVSRGLVSGPEGDHTMAAFMARSSVLLRGPMTGSSHTEVRILVVEHSAGRIWAGGLYHIALWDARTREVMKVLGAIVLSEPSSGSQQFSQGTELLLEEDGRAGYAKVSKKDKSPASWLQRSKNAVMGAAEAVRRAADRVGQVSEESRRLEALVAATDGTVWSGLSNGLLVQWNGEGTRIKELHLPHVASAIKCMVAVGNRLWVGYANGRVQVVNCSGGSLGAWRAHHSPLVQMARGGNFVFTLAVNGGIRGWHVASPSPLDALLHSELASRAGAYTQQQRLRVMAATWNVSQDKVSQRSLQTWLAGPAADASIVFVGLQEMEMGAGAIGMAAVKETVGLGLQDKGSSNGQWWLDSIGAMIGGGNEFERVGSRQLAGLLVGVWVRRTLLPHVGDVDAAAVACGFGRTFGNKGAVGIKMTIFRRTICAVNSHFAAHQEKVANRNADFEYVYNQMVFTNRTGAVATAAANTTTGMSLAVQSILQRNSRKNTQSAELPADFVEGGIPLHTETEVVGEAIMPDLSQADMLVWFGDFNYRIDVSFETALDLIARKQFDVLVSRDQLRNEMSAGRTFPGMREGLINFPPTYKFDRGSQSYDTSEKRRIPAWCDRVVFRDSFDGNDVSCASKLSRPAKASVIGYEACMEVMDSDHKPVRCLLNVDLAVINEGARRREFGAIMHNHPHIHKILEVCNFVPKTRVNRNIVILEDSGLCGLHIENEDQKRSTSFMVHCEGEPGGGQCPCGSHSSTNTSKGQSPRGGYGFPQWLQVYPACGVIQPNDSVDICIRFAGPGPAMEDNLEITYGQPSWWGTDQKEKVVVLVVTLRGALSTAIRQHRLCVCKGPASGFWRPAQRGSKEPQFDKSH